MQISANNRNQTPSQILTALCCTLSRLVRAFVAAAGCAFLGSQTPREVGCLQPSFLVIVVVEHKAQRHFEGLLSISSAFQMFEAGARVGLKKTIVPHVDIEMYISI